ncbi:MAG: homocysteine biosynthesis protein [Halobacteriota archaeon]
MPKSLEEINERIRDGSVHVVTADEMTHLVDELGAERAAKEVDVVTTGTFGAMCSSGAWMNFGHSDPPIKMSKVWLNEVEAYAGVAAVDAYIGATQLSETRGLEYGGAHVIEDLVAHREVYLKAVGYATDCYPRRSVETAITIGDLNDATMLNPRNAYQRYNVATNSTDRVLYTYMGTLLPKYGNATYSGSGTLSPIYNDPDYETIGVGTKIFLCGAEGYVVGHGTQHDPANNFGTLMVSGELKSMSTDYLRAAIFHKYGTSLYVGIGVPIPVLNAGIARKTAISDADIRTTVLDYGVGRRSRPELMTVNYEELKSGIIDLNGKEVRTSSMSSFFKAKEIATELAQRIRKGTFELALPTMRLPNRAILKPMKQLSEAPLVREVMLPSITVHEAISVQEAAKIIVGKQVNHLPVVSAENKLIGIVTAYDISKAVALNKGDSLKEIMTKRVITAKLDEPIDLAARRLERHNISALPVVDQANTVVGIITSEDLSKLLACR